MAVGQPLREWRYGRCHCASASIHPQPFVGPVLPTSKESLLEAKRAVWDKTRCVMPSSAFFLGLLDQQRRDPPGLAMPVLMPQAFAVPAEELEERVLIDPRAGDGRLTTACRDCVPRRSGLQKK